MSPLVLLLAFVSIVLAAGAQTLLKMGVSTPTVQSALHNIQVSSLWTIASSRLILAGLTCFGLSVLLWLSVLARVPLSLAYPAVAFGIVLTLISGHFILGEALSAYQLTGVAMIIVGVAVVTLG
jgi:multidrug transporter EmrE-like cation transporter